MCNILHNKLLAKANISFILYRAGDSMCLREMK